MKKIPLAVAIIFLLSLLPVVALADGTGSVKVIDKDGNDITDDNHEEGDSSDNKDSNDNDTGNTGFESIEGEDYFRNEVSAGNKMFVESLLNGLYNDLKENPENEDGQKGGLLFSVLTFVPNPYEDAAIVDLYGGYLNLTLYMILLFLLGELTSRSIARSKMTSGMSKYKDLSGHKFVGGIAMCGLALVANVFYMLALDITEGLNEYITVPAIPDIAISPDNLIGLFVMGLCDSISFIFFGLRYIFIYLFAVICSVVAVLLVYEYSRDFAIDCIEKMIRLLTLQPASLFVTVVGLVAIEGLPGFVQRFWYILISLSVFITCWYFMFGNFTLLKKSLKFLVKKGVTKV